VPFATVRDATFFYTDEGQGDVVLFIHGLTWDHTLWDAQVAALRDRYRCIAVDLIGHGQTADVDHDYTFFDLADYMAGLLETLAVERAHVVGLSMGGMTAMPMALSHPRRVRSLALLDTDAQAEGAEKAAGYQQLGAAIVEHGWPAVSETVAAILFGAPYLSVPANKESALRKLNANQREAVGGRALRTVTHREDLLQRLGAISVPTTVIVGELDVATTPDKSAAMAAAIPGATLVTIPAAGHHSPLENPAAVTAALEAHLIRADPTVPAG
jgi:pimeloyl-ACP methyl ester carboxylesterase